MAIDVKICGISEACHAEAAVEAGAAYLGFVFFAPSPRNLTIAAATALGKKLPQGPNRVGVFVNAEQTLIKQAVDALELDIIQLHGKETPLEAAFIKEHLHLPVMKAIALSTEADLAQADPYLPYVDRILFDAKPPKDALLPGGNAVSFPWHILKDKKLPYEWMVAGGLTPENVAKAIAESGATALDVSSGVETAPGKKSSELIKDFLSAAKEAK